MSKRRYFLLDEDVPLSLGRLLGRKSVVDSIEKRGQKGLPDAQVIDLADDLTATIVTNDDGLAKRFRGLRDRKMHGECHYGLVLITAPTEAAQTRLLTKYAKSIVWNEVAEQDMYVHIESDGKLTMRSLCTHTNYQRGSVRRKRRRT